MAEAFGVVFFAFAKYICKTRFNQLHLLFNVVVVFLVSVSNNVANSTRLDS